MDSQRNADKKSVIIVSPGLEEENNGNWQTAARWKRFLEPHYRVELIKEWEPDDQTRPDAVIALHATKSGGTVRNWMTHKKKTTDCSGLAVVLTGTDLYRDMLGSAPPAQSLEASQAIVVLQDRGLKTVPNVFRPKTRVIYQSCQKPASQEKPAHPFRCVVLGHLREEKSPETIFELARLFSQRTDLEIVHIGKALDAALELRARETESEHPVYRWLGEMTHENCMKVLGQAHVLIHPSRMEGGAHAILESIRCGTPVLASDVEGNIGMLGSDYAGYFPWGDAEELKRMVVRCKRGWKDPGNDALYHTLIEQCAKREPLFLPETEEAAVLSLVQDLLKPQE